LPGTVVMKPCRSSSVYAFVVVMTLTRRSRANWPIDGNGSPSRSSPDSTARITWRSICR
jgi:hypothetical protein